MNILFIDPGVWERSKVYPYYGNLPKELKKVSNCFVYDKKVVSGKLCLKACPFDPDIIVFGLGWFGSKDFHKVKDFDKLNIPKFCQVFKHGTDARERLTFLHINRIDLMLTPVPGCKDYWEKLHIAPVEIFKYGGDPNLFYDRRLNRIYDIGFSGALHTTSLYPEGAFQSVDLRLRAHKLLSKQKGIRSFLNGSDSIQDRIHDHIEYAKLIGSSKMWIATTCPFGDVSPRYYEVLMSKTLLFTNPVSKEYRDIFRDKETCVFFSEDLSDFLDKVHYYLDHEDERNHITETAYKEFHSNHTWRNRANELLELAKKYGRRELGS